jgi:hypothetical protein
MLAPTLDFHHLVSFASRCSNLRTKLGIPQSELARWLDVSPAHLSLETGMERDEDGVVLGSTRLPGSMRLHR